MLKLLMKWAAMAAIAIAVPVAAQVRTVDPNDAWQSGSAASPEAPATQNDWVPPETPPAPQSQTDSYGAPPPASASPSATIPQNDVFAAAERVFGAGAEGLAKLIEDILHDRGEPTAYITGQEAGAAFLLGVRYGSGILHHRIEGDRPIYWRGPSIGADVGADANKVFVLVYNLHDSQDLFRRYGGGEGRAYLVGGFTGQYLRRDDVVLIPIRMGVGLRLGVNGGYLRFSERNRWMPF
ncbi:MAG: DUF1134 domain-containing protein [Sphingosinicella sp.]